MSDDLRTEEVRQENAEQSAVDLLAAMGTDGAKWAAEFNATAAKLGHTGMDEGWLIGWFANAIEAGRRAGTSTEIERCAAIVSRARFGEIDGDLRSIIHRIENRTPADAE